MTIMMTAIRQLLLEESWVLIMVRGRRNPGNDADELSPLASKPPPPLPSGVASYSQEPTIELREED
jgi:hypothetical protein